MYLFKPDEVMAEEMLDRLLTAMQEDDAKTLKSLFSDSAIATSKDFDADVSELLEYFDGKVVSVNTEFAPCNSDKMTGDHVEYTKLYPSYDVTTDKQTYRICFEYITEHVYEPNKIGVNSFYIIKFNDDCSPECTYWGDGKDTPGINIGIPRITED